MRAYLWLTMNLYSVVSEESNFKLTNSEKFNNYNNK